MPCADDHSPSLQIDPTAGEPATRWYDYLMNRSRHTKRDRRIEAARIRISAGTGTVVDDLVRAEVRPRLVRKLGAFTSHVDRIGVRFDDIMTSNGGLETGCRITVVLDSVPAAIAEARADNAALALRRAVDAAGRMLHRAMRHARFALPNTGRRGNGPGAAASAGRAKHGVRDDEEGSLIGRRVGQSPANLARALARPEKQRRDAYVDTAAPGSSASDRAAGYGATAARNTKRRTAGMLAALEDSRTTPSRKLSRRSANRAKAATLLQRTTQLELHGPGQRARRAHAAKP